jgi:anaerobic selenocysteine-containing dehydrogenase
MKKRFLLAGAMGISGGLLYFFSRSNKLRAKAARLGGEATSEQSDEESPDSQERDYSDERLSAAGEVKNDNPIIDDPGIDQVTALNILTHIRDTAFESSDEKLAIALGRPAEEVEAWTRGSEIIDSDVVMKARHLAMERGIEIA